jgi:hypothetical protein
VRDLIAAALAPPRGAAGARGAGELRGAGGLRGLAPGEEAQRLSLLHLLACGASAAAQWGDAHAATRLTALAAAVAA